MTLQKPRGRPTDSALFSTKRKLSPQAHSRRRERGAHRLNGLLRASIRSPCKLAHEPVDVGDRASDADSIGSGVERGTYVARRTDAPLANAKAPGRCELRNELQRRKPLPGRFERVAAERSCEQIGAQFGGGDPVRGAVAQSASARQPAA